MIGLIRGLVEWLPTSADWAGYVAGPLAVLGYLAGSVPLADVAARRWKGVDAGSVAGPLAALVTLVVATVAWDVGLEVSPRGHFSAVGTYSNQALGAWVSIALWSGTAALVGSMAPLWTGFRNGGTGVTPAVALLVAYTPFLAAAGLAAGIFAFGLGARWRHVIAAGAVTVVAAEYVAWVADLQPGWGITNGPEVGLWSALVAVVLMGRNLRRA